MKHRILMVLVLISTVAFAASAQMRGGMMQMHGGAGAGFPGETDEVTQVELTGQLRLEANRLPVLVADGEEYTLQMPHALSAELEVSDGQTVQVSGYRFERPSRDLLGPVTTVMVLSIEVDGTRYIMPMMGPDGHRGNGRQPRGGHRHGGAR